jgi:hypothetical protein
MKRLSVFFGLSVVCLLAMVGSLIAQARAESLPEPGPENAGLRLRLRVDTAGQGSNETFHARLDLINTTAQPVRLRADWEDDSQKGDFKEWLEADASIETYPEIIPWMGQAMAGRRTSAQPEIILRAKETLRVEWTASGRRLKNKVDRVLYTQNPTFPTDGLYAVHTIVRLRRATDVTSSAGRGGSMDDWRPQGDILLRSNEQMVPVGGSQELPKHSYGRVMSVNTNRNTATIDLGALQKITPGDHFMVYAGMIGDYWDLRITTVHGSSAEGTLTPMGDNISAQGNIRPSMIAQGRMAELIPPDDPRFKKLPTGR